MTPTPLTELSDDELDELACEVMEPRPTEPEKGYRFDQAISGKGWWRWSPRKQKWVPNKHPTHETEGYNAAAELRAEVGRRGDKAKRDFVGALYWLLGCPTPGRWEGEWVYCNASPRDTTIAALGAVGVTGESSH